MTALINFDKNDKRTTLGYYFGSAIRPTIFTWFYTFRHVLHYLLVFLN